MRAGSLRGMLLAVFVASVLSGCEGGQSASVPTTAAVPQQVYSPTPVPSIVSWRLLIVAEANVVFAIRAKLDGETIAVAEQSLPWHEVNAATFYSPGEHVWDVEITSASAQTATYRASCTIAVLPSGTVMHVDGVPSEVRVGEALRLRVTL